ncbi:MAG: ribbon-helix-helix protein, CopG family [Actinobacteria bacterium]|nr:ribbon-helix-helix protein, CopG family [Actinomycetota bacterium]
MARKQVLVQLDDELVAELDRRAKKGGTSRSELIRRAIAAHLRDLDWEEKDRILVETYERIPQNPAEDEAIDQLTVEGWPDE